MFMEGDGPFHGFPDDPGPDDEDEEHENMYGKLPGGDDEHDASTVEEQDIVEHNEDAEYSDEYEDL